MNIQHELRVFGHNELLKKFYNDNKVTTDDIKVNPVLYPNETRLSFEKCISTASVNIMYKKYKEENSWNLFELKNKNKSVTKEDFITFLWGTSSNASEVSFKKIDSTTDNDINYVYHFVTKDSSPIVWFYAVSQKYTDLLFDVKITKNGVHQFLQFGQGDLISLDHNQIKQIKQKESQEPNIQLFFDEIIKYMVEKKIDYTKYMKRIYEKHLKEADHHIEDVDFEGVFEDFIEKVKIEKFISKKFKDDEDLIYENSKEFVQFILHSTSNE